MSVICTEVWVLMAHVDHEADEVVGVFTSRDAGEREARDWFYDAQFVVPVARDDDQTQWRSTAETTLRNHRDMLTLTRWDLQ